LAESLKYLAFIIPDKLGRVPVSSELSIDQSHHCSVRRRITRTHTREIERERERERERESHALLDDKSLPIERHTHTHTRSNQSLDL